MTPDGFQRWHICEGRALIRVGEPDLVDNPELWRSLWVRHRIELLRESIAQKPGSRPSAWWRFAAPEERRDGESEPDYLRRHDLIGPDELAAIQRRAQALAEFDSCRSPYDRESNFIPPTDLERFAAKHGLLTQHELEILNL